MNQIEFPSILLPSSISSGSIVDINVSRNYASENAAQKSFDDLQNSIYSTYGQVAPSRPILRCRNATQTSLVLEWDPIDLATSELRSLALYRNGSKAGNIPRPLEVTSTKISGLAIDTEYTFYLVLRTSGGTFKSEELTVRTHKMTDLSGITVTPGVLPAQLRYSLSGAVERIGGKIVDTVRIDTTHFVCTEGRGREWERAVEMNIPVVRPEWVEGCEREGRIVGVRGYYLNADPRLRQVGQGVSPSIPSSRRGDSASSAPRLPQTASDGRQQDGPPTGRTDASAVSPLTGNTSGAPRSPVTPGPPAPPAKDTRQGSPMPSHAPDASPNPAESTADDEETPSDQQEYNKSTPGPRDLVQSPFESKHNTSGIVDRTQHIEPKERNQKAGEASETGSFSEVQL
jgi:hypothetical protein